MSSTPKSRAFVAGVVKDKKAAEVREEQRMSLAKAKATGSADTHQFESEWPDFLKAKAPSYESALSALKPLIAKDPLKSMLEFPDDDWTVVHEARDIRTEEAPIPAEAFDQDTPAYVKQCAFQYSQPWTIVKRKYAGNTQGRHRSLEECAQTCKNQNYPEIADRNLEDLASNDETPITAAEHLLQYREQLHIDVLKYHHGESDLERQNLRKQGRTSIMSSVDDRGDEDAPPLMRLANDVPQPQELFGARFVVRFIELKASFPFTEPFFCSAVLYDIKRKARISEAFYFELNDQDTLLLYKEKSLRAKDRCSQAIFSVSCNLADVAIVIKVDKVLEGTEMAKVIERYQKLSEVSDDKSVEKYKTAFRQNSSRVGQFLMPFCWGAMLFKDSVSSGAAICPVDLDLYFHDREKFSEEDLTKYLTDLTEKKGLFKKLRKIDAKLEFHAKPLLSEEKLHTCLTSNMLRVKPFMETPGAFLSLEVQEFLDDSAGREPYSSFRHHLFVYPESADMRSTSYRNIACRVEFLAKETAPSSGHAQGLPCMYNPLDRTLDTHRTTSVLYHNKFPDFHDEIKVALPIKLNERHHLLFTFYHISCNEKSSDKGSVEKPIGYAWLPFNRFLKSAKKPSVGSCLNVHDYQLLISSELTPGYSQTTYELDTQSASQKQCFRVQIRLDSTVVAADPYLQSFLSTCSDMVYRDMTTTEDDVVAACVRNVKLAEPTSLFNFLHSTLNQLLYILTLYPETSATNPFSQNDVSRAAFDSLAVVVGIAHYQKSARDSSKSMDFRAPELQSFVKHVFSNTPPGAASTSRRGAWVFEALASALRRVVLNGDQQLDAAGKQSHLVVLTHGWFFFEVILKSMAEYLHSQKLSQVSRENRFNQSFNGDIHVTVMSLVYAICEDRVQPAHRAKTLNSDIAFFIRDLLSFMDRGFVFGLIHDVMRMNYQTPKPGFVMKASDLANFRIELLRIICSHEHFIALNLPNGVSSNLGIDENLVSEHYLVGLVLCEVKQQLKKDLHGKAVSLLGNLLICHDDDARYQSPQQRLRVASLYFPLVNLITSGEKFLLTPYDVNAPQQCDQSAERKLLLYILHVFNQSDPVEVHHWWSHIVSKDIEQAMSVLRACVNLFEYSGVKRGEGRKGNPGLGSIASNISALPDISLLNIASRYQSGGTGMAHRLLQVKRTDEVSVAASPIKPRSDDTDRLSATGEAKRDIDRVVAVISNEGRPEVPKTSILTRLQQNLSVEAALTILDVIEVFMQFFFAMVKHDSDLHSDSSRSQQIRAVFDVLIALISCNQSSDVIQHVLRSVQGFIHRFPNLLYRGNSDYCAPLCLQVLRQTAHQSPEVRELASAIFYLLMRKNFEESRKPIDHGANCTRVKVQSTIAISQIVSSKSLKEQYFRRALGTIVCYAHKDRGMRSTVFPQEVEKLALNLYNIVRDTAQVKEHEMDVARTMDIYQRIADGYRNSPDLRLTWLLSMAKLHESQTNHAEAAQCNIHAAALVSEYLNMSEVQPGLPVGCIAFVKIAADIESLESAANNDSVSPDQENICDHEMFNKDGLMKLLQIAAKQFEKAQMYEYVNEVYKILIPIYEVEKDFKLLAEYHRFMYLSYDTIVNVIESGKRIFATYYRLAFFGDPKLLPLDIRNKHFIYREKGLVTLSEVTLRVQKIYSSIFKPECFELITDSKRVDATKLSDVPNKVYVQVTFVQPFVQDDLERQTDFEVNNNIRTFMFETPFTKSGNARGNIMEQFMRKTYLTVRYAFPFMKSRQEVIATREDELTPLEVAIETITNRAASLELATRAKPVNLKLLQLQLQGSVSVSVNEGPTAIADAFLRQSSASTLFSPDPRGALRRKLCAAFKRFLRACKDAIDVNAREIQGDRFEYQENLKAGFSDMEKVINPMIRPESSATIRDTDSVADTISFSDLNDFSSFAPTPVPASSQPHADLTIIDDDYHGGDTSEI